MAVKIASIERTLPPMLSARGGTQMKRGGDTNNVTKDFRIALAAMTSPADFKMLEEQFLVKE